MDLQHCVQKQNEPLRDFIQRWTTLHHTVENVTEHQAVCAFKAASARICTLSLAEGDISMSKMMEIATRYANGEEDRIRRQAQKRSAKETEQHSEAKRSPIAHKRAVVTNAKFKGKGKA
ncbi:hypothetical protein ZWY2020_043396 [Hordeum vulgare]|nr:hypothetical protein ZWY2020_043396 [Hordeum vulgare]